jgi:hypothetical protein
MEYYSATKNNEIMSFIGKWTGTGDDCVTIQKDRYHIFVQESRPKK